MNIYLASSASNMLRAGVARWLTRMGHEVYVSAGAFEWTPNPDVTHLTIPDPANDQPFTPWTPENVRYVLTHSHTKAPYERNLAALDICDACLLILPCDFCSSWELGYAMALGRAGYVMQLSDEEPHLMYRGAHWITSANELTDAFARTPKPPELRCVHGNVICRGTLMQYPACGCTYPTRSAVRVYDVSSAYPHAAETPTLCTRCGRQVQIVGLCTGCAEQLD